MDRPQYINWIAREDGVVFEDQQSLNCYRLSYHQYVTELTYILFLKMCKETGTEGAIPEQYRWDKLLAKQGVELKKFYKELLEHLGESCTGRVREIYQGAQSNIDEPKNLEKIIQTIDQFDWYTAKEEGLGNLYEGLLETSLDKGTQRKTTENELPSLTQCTA